MSLPQATASATACPADALRQQLHQRLDQIIDDCLGQADHGAFFAFEKSLLGLLACLGQLLMQLFLHVRQQRLDLSPWLTHYRIADHDAPRTLPAMPSHPF